MTPTQRTSARAMLLAEDRAKKRITRAVTEVSDHAVAQLSRKTDRERLAMVLLALVAASRLLANRLSAAIVESRQDARVAGAKRLGVELVAGGVVGAVLGASRTGSQEDHAYADSAAASLAAAWGGLSVASAAKAAREERSVARALDRAATQMRSRIGRTAATEVASAYNAEHSAALREAARVSPRLFDRVVRVWNADLDKRTCSRCDSLHETEVDADEDFSDGDPPLHSNCRCFVTIVQRDRAAWAA